MSVSSDNYENYDNYDPSNTTERLYKLAKELDKFDNTNDKADGIMDMYSYVNDEWLKSEEVKNAHYINVFTEIQDTIDHRIKDIINNDNGIVKLVDEGVRKNYTSNGSYNKQHMGNFPDLISLISDTKTLGDLGHVLGALEVHMTNSLFSSFANQDPTDSSITKYTIMPPSMLFPIKSMYVSKSYDNVQQGFIKHANNVANIYNNLVEDKNKIKEENFGESVYNMSFYMAMSLASSVGDSLDRMYSVMTPESFINSVKMCSGSDNIKILNTKSNDTDNTDNADNTDNTNNVGTNISDILNYINVFGNSESDESDKSNIYVCDSLINFWNNYFNFIINRGDEYSQQYCRVIDNQKCTNVLDEMIVYNIEYFQHLSEIISVLPLEYAKNYLIYSTIENYCLVITDFDKTKEEYEELSGDGSYRNMEERVVHKVTEILRTKPLGYVLENMYSQRYGSPEMKMNVNKMIDSIKKEMKICIDKSNLFSNETKEEAFRKLLVMKSKVGYPTKSLFDYNHSNGKETIDELKYRSKSLLDMFMHLATSSFESEFIDRIIMNSVVNEENRWNMIIYEPNAYYDPRINGFAIPLGILNYPIYDYRMSDAEKYAKLGMIIAHEMSHGFDNRGKEYDSKGDLKDWWNTNDNIAYKKYADCIVRQYDEYGLNGELTLGENISDLVGVNLAYRAFIKSGDRSIYDKRVFFLAYSKLWRSKMPEEMEEIKKRSDPHALNRYRVWVVRNMDELYDVIPISNLSPMFLQEEMRIKPFYDTNIVLDIDNITFNNI